MKKLNSGIIYLIPLVIIAIVILVVFFVAKQNKESAIPSPSPESISVASSELDNTPKPYPKIKWGNPKKVRSLNDSYLYDINQELVDGFSWSGQEWKATLTDVNHTEVTNFISEYSNYFENEFAKIGWGQKIYTKDGTPLIASSADGGSGSMEGSFGYKDNNIRYAQWGYQISYKYQRSPADASECPCDITATYFLSDIIPTNEVIK